MATGGTDGGDRVSPEASYRVEVPPALLETHHGEVGLATSPQGFCRFASGTGVGVRAALEGVSVARASRLNAERAKLVEIWGLNAPQDD